MATVASATKMPPWQEENEQAFVHMKTLIKLWTTFSQHESSICNKVTIDTFPSLQKTKCFVKVDLKCQLPWCRCHCGTECHDIISFYHATVILNSIISLCMSIQHLLLILFFYTFWTEKNAHCLTSNIWFCFNLLHNPWCFLLLGNSIGHRFDNKR